MDANEIIVAIRELRRRENLSQAALAAKMGVNVLTANRLENQIRGAYGSTLAVLAFVARECGQGDIAAVFECAIEKEISETYGIDVGPVRVVRKAIVTGSGERGCANARQ